MSQNPTPATHQERQMQQLEHDVRALIRDHVVNSNDRVDPRELSAIVIDQVAWRIEAVYLTVGDQATRAVYHRIWVAAIARLVHKDEIRLVGSFFLARPQLYLAAA